MSDCRSCCHHCLWTECRCPQPASQRPCLPSLYSPSRGSGKHHHSPRNQPVGRQVRHPMCPFSSGVKASGCRDPSRRHHLYCDVSEGCNPRDPGTRPDDCGNCMTVQNPPARQVSQCGPSCSKAFSGCAPSKRSTCGNGWDMHQKIDSKSCFLFGKKKKKKHRWGTKHHTQCRSELVWVLFWTFFVAFIQCLT